MGVDDGIPPAIDDLVGMSLGHCHIMALLGEGGMARVYCGRQEQLERDVAIKVLPPYYAADQAFVERFKREARALARLAHPNILVIHDTGEERGHLFIIMEYIRGGSLKQYMLQALPLPEVGRIIREVAAALGYAHANNVIHRDVKPANVLMDVGGRAVLSDFGIAKVLATSRTLTRTGAGVGTPEYMSPEQCRGGTVDARSDIYALGVMLYELLTMRTPFEADNYTALAHAHVYEPVIPPSRFNPRISPAVQAVAMKALEKDPANRFQQAAEMAIALDQAIAAQQPLTATAWPANLSAPARAPASGTQVAPIVLCPRCHARNAAEQKFCAYCGLPFGPVAARQAGSLAARQMAGAPVRCPRCHTPNRPIDRFCTTCGAPMPAGPACQSCGAPNLSGSSFCTACGTRIA